MIILGEPSCVIIRYISNNCNQGISNNQRTEMYNVRGPEAQEKIKLSTLMHPMSIFAVVSFKWSVDLLSTVYCKLSFPAISGHKDKLSLFPSPADDSRVSTHLK